MNITPKCLLQIKHVYPDLAGKYRDIADYILAGPEKIVRRKAREIARACRCDESLIIRFCQKIGYSGFSELKMSLAAEFMPVRIAVAEQESSPHDSFARIQRNFLDNNSKVLHDTVSLLNERAVERAARMLSGAKRIFLLGAGASGIVALDVQAKLLRLGFNAIFHQDGDFARLFCGLVEPDDAVLAISFSGATPAVCETAEMARAKKAPVICVTNYPHSRLARMADVRLLTASDEKVFRLGAMTSRIAQLLALDFLMIYMALQNMARSEENVLRTHEMLRPSKTKDEVRRP